MYNELMDCSRVLVGSALVALADPTRRGMVELLAERPRRVGELVAAFPMSQPAVIATCGCCVSTGLVEERPLDGDQPGAGLSAASGVAGPAGRVAGRSPRFWAAHLEQFRAYVEAGEEH